MKQKRMVRLAVGLVAGAATIAGGLVVGTPPAQAASCSYRDVTTFATEISWLCQYRITTVTGTYGPNNPLKRSEMAAFVYRLAGSPYYTAPKASPFSDVRTTDAFYKEISWLQWRGIAKGWLDSNGRTYSYRPNDNITRADAAVFLYRLSGQPPYTRDGSAWGSGTGFFDVSLNDSFGYAVRWMKKSQIANGEYVAGRGYQFRPYSALTRGEAAAFLYRDWNAVTAYLVRSTSRPCVVRSDGWWCSYDMQYWGVPGAKIWTGGYPVLPESPATYYWNTYFHETGSAVCATKYYAGISANYRTGPAPLG
ncbi:MAG: S-layer homology domain-containing protein [Propionibacteriaceae bacterium]|jgi:hypothetical protein|nr:S-layer homology domain-containing protein [Propionibacteriaceae bacterium]